jgi:hypothetical protein
VDRVKRIFYILTRVDHEELESVNVLCLGSISLPLEATFRGVYAESSPHLAFEMEGKNDNVLGAEPMKSRNTIGRKSLAKN